MNTATENKTTNTATNTPKRRGPGRPRKTPAAKVAQAPAKVEEKVEATVSSGGTATVDFKEVEAKTPIHTEIPVEHEPFDKHEKFDMSVFVLQEDRQVSGYMTPKAMAGLLFISNFEKEDPDSPAPDKHGYQREVMVSRIPGMARAFLEEGNNPKVPSLTLSARVTDKSEIKDFIERLNRGDKYGIIEKYGDKALSIVDGQHRFLGLVRAHELDPSYNPRIPVSIHFGLTFTEEARLFDTINSTQRKLPKALIEATKTDVTEVGEVTYQQRIRKITMALVRGDAESVWHNRVNMTGARNPEKPITFEGLRRSLTGMFPLTLLEQLDAAEKDAVEVAKLYWNLVAEACEAAWNGAPREEIHDGNEVWVKVQYRLRELVGVAATAKLGQNIISSSLEHENFDERMKSLVYRLADVDWTKSKDNPWMSRSQAGFAGQPELYAVLHGWVYSGKLPMN